jgi:hypothetical protein
MDTQCLPLVSFGKYKGQPITTLMNDTKYLEWLKQQSWFSNHKQIYNIVVHQTIFTTNNSKTPEHNKLQNLFLDKINQEKLLSKLFNINLPDGINNLFTDEDITRCFGENIIPEFINKLDKTTIKFEDKFNWDLVLYYKDIQYFTITSKLETELIDKEKYKEQYDIEQKQIYLDAIQKHDEKIKIREVIDKEQTEDFETKMKNYIEQRDNNQREVNKYDYELQKYIKIRLDYELTKFKELCVELRINVYFDNNKIGNNYSYQTQKGIHSVSNSHNYISYLNKNTLFSEKEKKIYEKIICDKLDNIMKEWENDNVSLIPKKIKKINIPELFDINKPIYSCSKYADVIKGYSLDNIYKLKQEKKEYENEYKKEYENNFNEHYEKYRLQYYRDIIKKYCNNNVYIEKINENQHEISIDICKYNYSVCCELKPTLSDDYPHVLRKLKTQIELTQNDKTNFEKLNKKYILIIGSFTSIHVSKKQLITIFKQSNIKIIFTDKIFETTKSVTIKCVNTNVEQVLFENKLIEENKFLTDNLLQTQQKLLQAEENKLLKLKQSKSIKDYFGKK